MGRAPCCDKTNVKKGSWSPEEDATLKNFIEKNGTGGNWIALPQKIGLKRCGKSCRLRWLNYLRPNLKHGCFSEEEDRIISSLYISIGSRWSAIAAQLPGRTDNDIKNYWNTSLKKKLFGNKSIKDQNQKAKREQKVHDLRILDNSVKYGGINNVIKPHTYWPEPYHALMHPINQVQRQALDDNTSIRRVFIELGEKSPSNDDASLFGANSLENLIVRNQVQMGPDHELYREEFDEMFNCNFVKLEGSLDNCYYEGIRVTNTTAAATSNNSNWSEVSLFDNYQVPMSMDNFQGMQQGFFDDKVQLGAQRI